jgi:PTS system mannose-specific IID component
MSAPLTRGALWRVFVRSLFIQAGFSTEGMQTLGLFFALEPALRVLYPEPEARKAALERHLVPFNTHPYVSAAIVGGILFHEQRIARGEEPPETVQRFKSALMGPLAALGDGFFWLSLRPAAGALAVAVVPVLGPFAALVFLGVYNLVHFSMRGWFFAAALKQGEGLLVPLSAAKVPAWGQRLRVLAAVCAGGTGGYLALRFGGVARGVVSPLLATVCLSGGALALLLVRRVSPYVLLYAAAAAAVALGAWR